MRLPRFSTTLLLILSLAAAGCQKPAGPQPSTPDAPAARSHQAPADTGLPGPAPVEGTDYVTIDGGAPFAPAVGKVEVAEVFGYTCPHCASFEPVLEAWAARQPEHVRLVRIPAPFGAFWTPYAKAYYVAQEMGLEEATHGAVFHAIHEGRTLPAAPAVPTTEQLATFYAGHGADPKDFAARMESYAIQAKLRRAMAFIMRSGVEGTPTMVVAGKYRVNGRSAEHTLHVVDHLVALEHAAARGR